MSLLFYAVSASSHFQMTVQRYNYFLIYANIFAKNIRKSQINSKKEIAPLITTLSRIKSGGKEERRSGCYPKKWTKPKRRDTRQRKEQMNIPAYNAGEIDEEKTRQRRWKGSPYPNSPIKGNAERGNNPTPALPSREGERGRRTKRHFQSAMHGGFKKGKCRTEEGRPLPDIPHKGGNNPTPNLFYDRPQDARSSRALHPTREGERTI